MLGCVRSRLGWLEDAMLSVVVVKGAMMGRLMFLCYCFS